MNYKILILPFVFASLFTQFSHANSFDIIRQVTIEDVSCTQSLNGFDGSVSVSGDLPLEISATAVVENNTVEMSVSRQELCDALFSFGRGEKVDLIFNQDNSDPTNINYSLRGLLMYPRVILIF